MPDMIKYNKKSINDPLYTPVEKFLKERIARLEIEGPEDELLLARERYTGIVAGDLVIENPVMFPDGITRVCFVSRKTGFARVDVDITRVTMKEILDDFSIPLVEIASIDNLKEYVKGNQVESVLLWCKWLNTYGVLLNQESAKTIAGPMAAFGELFFYEYVTTRDSLTTIDYETLESGTVKVADPAFGQGIYPLFIYELVLDEANVPEITSNLPESITTQRGQTFDIPNTYWFNTTEDITTSPDTTLEITTTAGYTIPRRADNLLSIEGETIFGSATEEVTDEIIVRVTYMWNGRPVRKTFRVNVLIEKDTAFDLTIETTPSEITAATGDVVEIKVKALYKDIQVTIQSPPVQFTSEKKYGNLTYQRTETDGVMIYSGTITGRLSGGVTSDKELYRAEFSYTENGQTTTAPGFLNMTLVLPEALPKFEIKDFNGTIVGWLDDTSKLTVNATYGDQVIPATSLGLDTGIKGPEGLIRYDTILADGIDFTLIRSGTTPGSSLNDAYEQRFVWIAPNGVRHTVVKNVTVKVNRRSVYEVLPNYPQPLLVTKYQSGIPPFKLMVNGVNVTLQTTNYSFVDPLDYIRHAPGSVYNWMVLDAPEDEDKETKVEFKFSYQIDGELVNLTYEQDYVVKKYEGADPENPEYNTNVVAVPNIVTITGRSDSTGEFEFSVFNEAEDITASAVVLTNRTEAPVGITMGIPVYNPTTGKLKVIYRKDNPTTASGKIYIARPGVANPTPDDIALLTINTNVTQSRILLVESYQTDVTLEVEVEGTAEIQLTFAGEPILLTDPNLSFVRNNVTDVSLLGVEGIQAKLRNDIWHQAGGDFTETMSFVFTYVDPENLANVTTANLLLPVKTVFPDVELIKTTETPILAKIWDTGTLPFNLMAGSKNWNSALTMVKPLSPNKYININRLTYAVISAETEEITFTLPLEFTYTIGISRDIKILADVVFTLEEWDQITFGAEWTPKAIDGKSGDTGEVVATFVYKGNDATADVVLNRPASTIPDTVVLGDGVYTEGKGIVSQYELTRGGEEVLILVYTHTPSGTNITISIDAKVQWADGINVVSRGTVIDGYWNDKKPFPLVINCSGVPVALNDPNLTVTFSSGDGDPITLDEIQADKLIVDLVAGGDLNTTYEYEVVIGLSYVDPASETWTESLTVPARIKIPNVVVSSNPVEVVKVWDRGTIKTALADERGRPVPITAINARGTNTYVSFISPSSWYVIAGNESTSINTDLGITLSYSMGGNEHTVDVDVTFNIAQYNGYRFVVNPSKSELNGKAGDTGIIKFTATYQGDPITGISIDHVNSVIPANLIIGVMDSEGNLPYTLVGQAVDTAKFVILRPGGAVPGVINVDKAEVFISVKSESSDEEFILVSHGDTIGINWMETGVVPVALKYGPYDLPANSPGLVYSLAPTAAKGVTIQGATPTGVVLLATRSNVPGGVKVYPEDIIVNYNVGSTTPKTVQFSTNVTITMGAATINNNPLVRAAIWDRGSYAQNVLMGDKVLNTVDHYEALDPENMFVEFTAPRSWEVIGGEAVVSTKDIPMRLYYRVDESVNLLTLDYTVKFELQPYTGTRFFCTYTPNEIGTGPDLETVLRVRPIYKDKDVVATAVWKKDLSVIPPQLEYKSDVVNGFYRDITFVGKVVGLSELKLVFWSPDAGSAPAERDVWTADIPVSVMGELGLEVGTRDNLLIGKNLDTGTYKLEMLFGGIPLDIQKEITEGRLTVTREAAVGVSPNAGTLNLVSWTAKTFNYELKGPVSPGKTVAVSDFLNFQYMYGGQPWTRRVEIPQQYTTGPVVVVAPASWTTKIWDKKTLTATSMMCDGVNLLSTWTLVQDGSETPNTYIKFDIKTFECINADVTEKTLTVPVNYVGTYRNWAWSEKVDTNFVIAAWNQITFEASIDPTSVNTIVGGAQWMLYATFKYKGIQVPGADWIDFNKTDFKGLFTLDYNANINTDTGPVSRFLGNSKLVGNESINIYWRHPSGENPGVVGKDFAVTPLQFKAVETPLTISGWSASLGGGNLDEVSAPLTIKLGNQNIPVNDPNMTITPIDETTFRLIDRTATAMVLQCTAPVNAPLVTRQVVVNVTWLNIATGKIHSGSYAQPWVMRLPSDYPKVTNNKLVADMWSRGGNPTTVMSGLVDVSADCVFTSWSVAPPAWVVAPTDNPNGDWYQVIGRSPSTPTTTNTATLTMSVPYRGDFVTIVTPVIIQVTSSGDSYQMTGTMTPKPFELGSGVTGELRFNLTYRGKPRTDLTLNLVAAGMNNIITINSNTADGDTTVLQYTGIINTPTAIFMWDLPGTSGNVDTQLPTQNRLKMFVDTYDKLKITPNVSSKVKIWDKPAVPFKIAAGTTDITRLITLTNISTSRISILTPSNTSTGPIIEVIDAPIVEDTIDVTYTFTVPATYGGGTYTALVPTTFEAWNGDVFISRLVDPNFKYNVVLNTNSVVGIITAYKGVAQTGSTASIDTASVSTGSDGALQYVSHTYSGGWQITNRGVKIYKGVARIGFNYTGPGSTDYPVGTLGKNYVVQEVPLDVFEAKLIFYPDDIEPAAVSGGYGSAIGIPCMFQYGTNPPIAPYSSYLTPDFTKAKGITFSNRTESILIISINYNNINDDYSYETPITWNYVNGAVRSSRTYNQKITIKGTNTGAGVIVSNVLEVSGKVWSKGALPFTIRLNGNVIAQSGIKKIAIDSNPYVTAGPTLAEAYQITDGPVDGITTTVKYRVTITDGVRDWDVVQDVVYKIAPYNGQELSFTWISPAPEGFNNGMTFDKTAAKFAYLTGMYRGVLLTSTTITGYGPISRLDQSTQVFVDGWGRSADTIYIQLKGKLPSEKSEIGRFAIGINSITSSGEAIEGKNFAYVDIPVYCYDSNKFYPISGPTVIEGKFGEQKTNDWIIRKGLTQVTTRSAGAATVDPAGTMRTDFNYVGNTTASLWWVEEITVPTVEKDLEFIFYPPADKTLGAAFKFKSIQHSNLKFPVVTNVQPVTAKIGESGAMPFRVTHEGTDVTGTISNVTISANSYVNIVNNQWHIYNAESGTATVLPEISFTVVAGGITYPVKQVVTFNVLGWNGKKLTATADNLIAILGSDGYINITGKFGESTLNGNVVFDSAKSSGGKFTLGPLEAGSGGNVALKYSPIELGTAPIVIRLNAVDNSGNENPNSDFVIINITGTVYPTTLQPIDDFEFNGEGALRQPASMKQAVTISGNQLSNLDPDMVITFESDHIVADTIRASVLTYTFKEEVTTSTPRTGTLTFTYKGTSVYTTPITINQIPSVVSPIITDVKDLDVSYGKSYGVPFEVQSSQE